MTQENHMRSVNHGEDEVKGSVPAQSAFWLHQGRLTESSDPAQHVLLSVGAEEVRAHPLVHNLRKMILLKYPLDHVTQDSHLLKHSQVYREKLTHLKQLL